MPAGPWVLWIRSFRSVPPTEFVIFQSNFLFVFRISLSLACAFGHGQQLRWLGADCDHIVYTYRLYYNTKLPRRQNIAKILLTASHLPLHLLRRTYRISESSRPSQAPHDNRHERQSHAHARNTVYICIPSPQTRQLKNPRTDSGQAATEPIHNALQNLASGQSATYATAHRTQWRMLQVPSHTQDDSSKYIDHKSAYGE